MAPSAPPASSEPTSDICPLWGHVGPDDCPSIPTGTEAPSCRFIDCGVDEAPLMCPITCPGLAPPSTNSSLDGHANGSGSGGIDAVQGSLELSSASGGAVLVNGIDVLSWIGAIESRLGVAPPEPQPTRHVSSSPGFVGRDGDNLVIRAGDGGAVHLNGIDIGARIDHLEAALAARHGSSLPEHAVPGPSECIRCALSSQGAVAFPVFVGRVGPNLILNSTLAGEVFVNRVSILRRIAHLAGVPTK